MNRKEIVLVNSVSVRKKMLTLTLTLTLTLMLSVYAFPWSEPVIIDSGPFNAYRTDIAFDSRGNAISVFEQKSGDFYRIFANRYVNGKGWQGTVTIDANSGDAYRAQVALDKEGNAMAVFKQANRVFANRYIYNEGWQGTVPIDNGTGNVDGQDIVFDSEGNAAAVFEEYNGKEFGIYVNLYSSTDTNTNTDTSKSSWSGAFRIDTGHGNAFFPYPLFDDKGNLYVIYYKEESSGLEVYVSRLQKPEVRSQKLEARSQKITYGNIVHKKEKWVEKKSEIGRGIKSVYNPMFLSELKKRIYSGNYSYSRWETPSKIDSRFRDAYRPTLLANGNGEVTALFVKWDGEYLSGYMVSHRNGKWGKIEEIDAGKGDVEHIRGAVNFKGEMAVVFTQWVDDKQGARGKGQGARGNENLRIHARIYSPLTKGDRGLSGWGEAKIIDGGKKDAYNPSIIFTNSGEIIAVWCQWEKANVKSYTNIYRNGIGWGNAERLENKEGETCGVRIASGSDGKVIAIFEQDGVNSEARSQKIEVVAVSDGDKARSLPLHDVSRGINRIFAVEFKNTDTVTNTDTYTVRKLTSGDREDYYAEFSPDGKMIVFVSKHGKYSNLYIMDADGKNMRQLTSGDVTDTAPVFTPDGGKIIFASNRIAEGWDIWSVRPDGSELTRITKWSRNEYSPHPTSDGKGVLYVSTAGGDHAIWSMDINGDNPRRLTSGGTGDWFPAMNPNGREIVFVSTRLGYGDIWTIDPVEKKYHRLTYSDLPEFSPAWSPDGSKIAYVTNKGGEFDIWIMDRDGKNKKRLTKGISDRNWGNRFSAIKIMETAGYYHLSWHPDGTKILFTEWGDNEKESCISILDFDKAIIDRLEADGTSIPEYTLIGEGELTKGEWEDFAPSFSPDGISLTFSSNRSGNWNIWSMEFNGENLRQLTDEKADALAPVFSPDGKEIAFLRSQKPEVRSQKDETNFENRQSSIVNLQYDLWLMKSDGSGARQVTKDIQVISYPAWNPNGKEIAFVAQGKDVPEIWTYNFENSKVRRLITAYNSQLKTQDSLSYPFIKFLYRIGYNPAGDKITFESNRSGNVEIWTMRSDGTNLARITNGDSPHWNPIWSPDGKMIAYTTDKLGEKAGHHNWRNYNIWVADPETHEEMLITGEEQIDWNPVWSPDGKKIVYVTNRSGDFKHFNLWVLYLK